MSTRQRFVRDVMTTAVVSAYRGASFKDIAQMMIERGITALPVIDKDRHVAGVVSEADLLAKEEYKGVWPETRQDRLSRPKAQAVTARDLMTTPAITISPDASIVQAARLLEQHRIKRLPVVDDHNRLLGIVSRRDLLRVFTRSDEEIRDEILQDVLTLLIPAAPEAVSVHVDHGIVTLTGTLDDKALIPVLLRLTAATDGVVSVIDELRFAVDGTAEKAGQEAPGT
ncbi:CBS domain-containing protein [Actinoallomurus sp. CA-150999]|uniref:CBS domain-containing protein n=1 Tax=Actinoallomurus sp. CA-150999 TaxID=3239887 RepID=UPI003D93B754